MKLSLSELTRKVNVMLNPSPGMRRALWIGLIVLIIGVVIALCGCQVWNTCVPDSVQFRDELLIEKKFAPYRWAEVVWMEWEGGKAHAFVAFEYNGRIMAWDKQKGGSWTLTKDLTMKRNPMALAVSWGNEWVKSAKFL